MSQGPEVGLGKHRQLSSLLPVLGSKGLRVLRGSAPKGSLAGKHPLPGMWRFEEEPCLSNCTALVLWGHVERRTLFLCFWNASSLQPTSFQISSWKLPFSISFCRWPGFSQPDSTRAGLQGRRVWLGEVGSRQILGPGVAAPVCAVAALNPVL